MDITTLGIGEHITRICKRSWRMSYKDEEFLRVRAVIRITGWVQWCERLSRTRNLDSRTSSLRFGFQLLV